MSRADTFEEIFHTPKAAQASAPGRVNLLGEHTDYNDGFVLPSAIPQRTVVSLGPSPDGHHHFYSAEQKSLVSCPPEGPTPQGFARYLFGCVRLFEREGNKVPPLNAHVTSRVPIGAGLSSSAALSVAALRALRAWRDSALSDVRIAEIAQQAEIEFAGVRCGIMDPMAASLGDTEHLLFLDTRTLERTLVRIPDAAEVLVMDSGVPRELATSGYNERRAECEEAARLLGVKALRDVTDPRAALALPEPFRRRARHVITENKRVLDAVSGVMPRRFGGLMNASHASLRDDYEVSVPALDALVEILQQTPEVFGARLTGAGFGGACVALVEKGQARSVGARASEQYRRLGHRGLVLVPEAHP